MCQFICKKYTKEIQWQFDRIDKNENHFDTMFNWSTKFKTIKKKLNEITHADKQVVNDH